MATDTKPATKIAKPSGNDGWPIFEVWKEYEKITMHFNDLLLKLRVQAVAGVAALGTVVGLVAKSETTASNGVWLMATLITLGLCMVWVAIWMMDFLYYNRLLSGAVEALVKLEARSQSHMNVKYLDMSTLIEDAVMGRVSNRVSNGVKVFYGTVLMTLIAGAFYSFLEWRGYFPSSPTSNTPAPQITNRPPSQ